jgi:opacity protein-like surface antigen
MIEGNALIRSRTACLLLFLLVGAVSARAQAPAHRQWEFTLFGGASYLGDGTHATPVAGLSQGTRSVGLDYASGYQVGARITENRWRHWGAALEYTFSNQPLTFSGLSAAAPSVSPSHSVHRFAYQVLYYPADPSERFRPYVLAGPGLSLFRTGNADAALGVRLNDPWKFAFHWGGGVKYLLRDQVGVVLQFSDSVSGVPGYGLSTTALDLPGQFTPGLRPDGVAHNWLVSIGFVYQWDER